MRGKNDGLSAEQGSGWWRIPPVGLAGFRERTPIPPGTCRLVQKAPAEIALARTTGWQYPVWVSEIMLQQTQVVTVIDYFNRFISKFPTVAKLAVADEAEVLKLWEGLGYYRRARQLHAAAKQIVAEHQGKFPEQFDHVLALPGVGRYTAGAIMSIAFDQPFPILEGNTIRVYARLLGLKANAREKRSEQTLWAFSESILPKGKGSRDLNQGLMELGSEICRVRQPDCPNCPVRAWCSGFAEGIQEKLPVLTPRMEYQTRHDALVIVQRAKRFLLRKCGDGEHWTGLWDFPRVTLNEPRAENRQLSLEDRVAKQMQSEFCLQLRVKPSEKRLRHAVTKYRITLDCFPGQLEGRLPTKAEEFAWVSAEELAGLPLNATGRKVANWIQTTSSK
jgi:A/G-specific adenine glycosylase